jgi:hypothetical protein
MGPGSWRRGGTWADARMLCSCLRRHRRRADTSKPTSSPGSLRSRAFPFPRKSFTYRCETAFATPRARRRETHPKICGTKQMRDRDMTRRRLANGLSIPGHRRRTTTRPGGPSLNRMPRRAGMQPALRVLGPQNMGDHETKICRDPYRPHALIDAADSCGRQVFGRHRTWPL